MKRRVEKVSDRRYRVELPGGDVSTFSYREKNRRWDPDQCTHVDFELDENRWDLTWEGLYMDSFPTESDVLLFILRFGYDIQETDLVPSEILADVNLVYEGGDWVDEWGCPDQHDVIFTMGTISKPVTRYLRFEEYTQAHQKRKTGVEGIYYDNQGIGHIYYHGRRPRKQEVTAEVKIPELDFEELERPRKRRSEISNSWSCPKERAWGSYFVSQKPDPPGRPDEECVFTLKIGQAAEKAYQALKKRTLPLVK